MSNNPSPVSYLLQEYEQFKALFELQPAIRQRFLESQARQIADALVNQTTQFNFSLPDRVKLDNKQEITVPAAQREQKVGGFGVSIFRQEKHDAVLHHLLDLEQSPDPGIAASANLLRFATARYMVFDLLPSGRTVHYTADGEELIPSIPTGDDAPESAITQSSDAIAEDGKQDAGRGVLQTPFVPAARKFFLPQWVAFDDKGKLLAGSDKEAEAYIHSLQRYAEVLHRASGLAPYIVACDEYQRKRYGILGQLVNQGRAMANFMSREIIEEIKHRARNNSLNRGLSLSLPYFNDQSLALVNLNFEVIPAGRIMFVPALVVRAAREEQAKVSQDTRLSDSTRKHLLRQLKALELAFAK